MGFGRGGLSFVGRLCGCEEADVLEVDVAAGGAFGADQVPPITTYFTSRR